MNWPERWDHCYEDMGDAPCGQPPVGAVRMNPDGDRDPDGDGLYPVCSKHMRTKRKVSR